MGKGLLVKRPAHGLELHEGRLVPAASGESAALVADSSTFAYPRPA
jgi:hypothetical protein